MSEKSLEIEADVSEGGYMRYRELGGIINERDYNDALSKLEKAEADNEAPNKFRAAWVKEMAKDAGIELNGQNGTDRRVILYSILREDLRPAGVEHHHSNMTDPRLFAEVLRILEDTESFDKLKTALHTNRTAESACPLCGRKSGEDCI